MGFSVSPPPSPLTKPLTLPCGLVLPNRLVKAAMTEALADDWGRPTPELCRLYQCWAQPGRHGGGIGTLITGNIQVDRRYVERPGNVCIDRANLRRPDEENLLVERLQQFASAGSASSPRSVMIAQISHAGRQSNGMVNLHPVGPGSVRLDMPLGKVAFGAPRPLEVAEIQGDVVPRFAYAAKLCQRAGFDGVQIHAAHGYLLSSFLNPRANNRPQLFGTEDPYGGSLECRARLLLDVVRAVQQATQSVGDDRKSKPFAVTVKLNSADFQQGGFTTQEAVQVAVWLEQAGVDMLELSGGNYETGAFYLTNQDKRRQPRESTRSREAFFLEYALQIQAAITELPVMVTGGWRTRAAMEAALQHGDCALIGIGRPLCGAPKCGAQLLSGEIDELPRYEQILPQHDLVSRFGSALCCCGQQMGSMVQMMAMQAWYYRNIVGVATTGEADSTVGLWRAMVANIQHESHLAKNLQGIDCVGQVYKGNGA